MIEITKSEGRWKISLQAIKMGPDLCVLITGGERPHLGALTYGSLDEPPRGFAFAGHKESIVTDMVSDILKRNFHGNFVVCCGIHLDNITSGEISAATDLCRELAEELVNDLMNEHINGLMNEYINGHNYDHINDVIHTPI